MSPSGAPAQPVAASSASTSRRISGTHSQVAGYVWVQDVSTTALRYPPLARRNRTSGRRGQRGFPAAAGEEPPRDALAPTPTRTGADRPPAPDPAGLHGQRAGAARHGRRAPSTLAAAPRRPRAA